MVTAQREKHPRGRKELIVVQNGRLKKYGLAAPSFWNRLPNTTLK